MIMKQAIDKRSPISDGERISEDSESRQGKHRISTESPRETGKLDRIGDAGASRTQCGTVPYRISRISEAETGRQCLSPDQGYRYDTVKYYPMPVSVYSTPAGLVKVGPTRLALLKQQTPNPSTIVSFSLSRPIFFSFSLCKFSFPTGLLFRFLVF